MATIFYSVSGEGRGHATRARAVVEILRKRHRVVMFSYGQAWQLLKDAWPDGAVEVRKIPGAEFLYTRDNKLDYVRSFFGVAVPYMWNFRRLARSLRHHFEADRPALLVADFEPLMPRAARMVGVPYISVDHQHFISTADFSALPWKLRAYVAIMRPFIPIFYRHQVETVVSSFFSPGIRANDPGVKHIGVMLRPEILETQAEHGEHVLAYFRRFAPPNVIAALEACGRPVRIYGMGEQPAHGNVQYMPTGIDNFVSDLSTCRALVCTAGNQLIGEALHFRKPVFALPEPGNMEQAINGWYIGRSRWGVSMEMKDVDAVRMKTFVDDADEYRRHIPTDEVAGNVEAVARIEHWVSRVRTLPLRSELAAPDSQAASA